MNNFIANRVHCCLNRLLHLVVDIIFECDVTSEDEFVKITIFTLLFSCAPTPPS